MSTPVRTPVQREEIYKVMVEQANDGLYMVDLDSRTIVFANPAFAEMFGYSAEELVCMNVLDIHLPEDEGRLQDAVRRVIQREGVVEEFWGMTKSGEMVCIEIKLRLIEVEGDLFIMCVARDITQRKRVEEALRESEERLRKIFEHSNDAIFVIDPERDKILNANPKACSMLGYSLQDLLSTSISAIHPDDLPKLMAFGQSVVQHGQGWTDELTCLTKDGQLLPTEISASTIEIAGRLCIISLIRDVSERKQANEALRESENRFRTIVEHAADAFLIIGAEGQFVDVNQRACESLGYTREELLALSVPDVQMIDEARETLRQIAPGVHSTLEGVHRRKDGTTFPVESRIGLIEVGGRRLTLALARDVSERKQSEHMLIEQMQELAVLEERNRLAREIHDTLAQSLTGIAIQLEVAGELLNKGPEAARASIESARVMARESLERGTPFGMELAAACPRLPQPDRCNPERGCQDWPGRNSSFARGRWGPNSVNGGAM